MKKTMLLIVSTALIFFNSCKKNVSAEPDNGSIIQKISAWLESQYSKDKLLKNEKIQRLRDNLDLASLRYDYFINGEQFIIIPVNKNFQSTNNKDKNPVTNLILIADASGKIRKGNIVQFIPEKESDNKTIPPNTFHNIFTSKKIDCDGRFVFCSINDWLLYEITYKNGNVRSYGVAKWKPAATIVASKSSGYQCYAQYLITTIHHEDGSTEVTEEYLGTFCSCPWGTTCDELTGEGAGGGSECCIPDSTIQLSSSSTSERKGYDCGMISIDRFGRQTKTCTYRWEFNRNTLLFYTWSYISIEQSAVEKVDGAWKFIPGSVKHIGMTREGNIPLCVSFDCDINSAIPSISTDRTMARMNLIYTTSFNISCCLKCRPHYESDVASDFWYAA